MRRLVDSCGWLEFFTDGPNADLWEKELSGSPDALIVPTIVMHEVYKFLKRVGGEEAALLAMGRMSTCRVVDLDATLALESADLALSRKLATADAIVYATALSVGAELVTSDSHFKNLPSVRFVSKTG